EINESMNAPYRKWLLLIVKLSPLKFGCPPIAAMIGVMMSPTSAVTTAAKAMPMTMPTAMSTRLPRSRNSLKSRTVPPCRGLRDAARAHRDRGGLEGLRDERADPRCARARFPRAQARRQRRAEGALPAEARERGMAVCVCAHRVRIRLGQCGDAHDGTPRRRR